MTVGGASGAATPVRMSRSNKEFFYRLRRFRRLVAEREQPELPISAVAVLEQLRADELSARCANLEFCMWSLLERYPGRLRHRRARPRLLRNQQQR